MTKSHGKIGGTAVITGATGGLGTELARVHASFGGDCILVGRRKDRLEALRDELEAKGVKAWTLALDLRDEGSAEAIRDFARENGIEVEYLINNAGFGGGGELAERPMEDDLGEIAVNVTALTRLTKLYLKDFLDRGHGRIMNIASQAAKVPGPNQAVYFATKAYVDSLSNAAWEEARRRNPGVTVTSVLPGPMATGFIHTASADSMLLFSRPLSPAKAAEKAYKAMLKGRLRISVAIRWWERIIMALIPIFPKRLVLKVVWLLQKDFGTRNA